VDDDEHIRIAVAYDLLSFPEESPLLDIELFVLFVLLLSEVFEVLHRGRERRL